MFTNNVMEKRGEREWVGIRLRILSDELNKNWNEIRYGQTINNGHLNATEYQGIIFHP